MTTESVIIGKGIEEWKYCDISHFDYGLREFSCKLLGIGILLEFVSVPFPAKICVHTVASIMLKIPCIVVFLFLRFDCP